MTVYDKIDEILKMKHMSRRKMAHAAGIPESTISSLFIRRPDRFPLEYALKIANVLQVNWAELLGVYPYDDTSKEELTPEEQKEIFNHMTSSAQRIKWDRNMSDFFYRLNEIGRQEAIKRVEELTCLSQYQATCEDD